MSEAAVISRRIPSESLPESSGRVLVIDDEAEIRESLETLLQLEGYNVSTAATGREGLAQLGERSFDIVLLDLALPDRNGMDVLGEIHMLNPLQPVIMITAYGTVENAVRAMQSGATNFIQKPWDNEKLLADVRAAVARQRAEEENVQLKRALKQRYDFDNIVGKSEPMLKIFDLVAQVAPSRSTILLQGESGTGKELIAKALHLHSARRDRPFVPVNTGSMPADLLESNLFGHVKGAFTSAIASKKGLFEVADRGTLFLDEIGTMTLDTQSKILRVLQDRKFMHLGGIQEMQVDVRIIAATNVDLRQMVREGRFREDLFYRLNVIPVLLPPLRDRKEDIPLLVQHFLDKFLNARYPNGAADVARGAAAPSTVSQEAMRRLMAFGWPGNVRQLENAIERAVALSAGRSQIDVVDLPAEFQQTEPALSALSSDVTLPEGGLDLDAFMSNIERGLIQRSLERTSGNKGQAARLLHLTRTTLVEKLKRIDRRH
jgi:DNA-binding NtrC family response regulator